MSAWKDARVVDEHVDATTQQAGCFSGEVPGRLRRAVEIDRDEVGAAARGADLIHDFGAAFDIATADDDVRAFSGEAGGDGSAHVAGGAGDQCGLVEET